MGFLRILEIISLITTLIGLYLLGEKVALGFIIFTVSLGCQIYIFYKGKNWFLVVQMIVLITFNIFNYFKWIGG
jgi:hypothetical protein